MHPEIGPLLAVTQALGAAGIECALGGGGLLHSFGLIDRVGDWDVTTDAPLEQLQQALQAFPLTYAVHGDGPFATAYRIAIDMPGAVIDLEGQFAIRSTLGVCHLPAIVSGFWQGVPVGSPEVWAVAYRLMERHPKADILDRFLSERGANPDVVKGLLAEPLPPELRAELSRWPVGQQRQP